MPYEPRSLRRKRRRPEKTSPSALQYIFEPKGKSLGQLGYERFFNSLKCFISGVVANPRSAMARVRSLQDWISTQHDQKKAAVKITSERGFATVVVDSRPYVLVKVRSAPPAHSELYHSYGA